MKNNSNVYNNLEQKVDQEFKEKKIKYEDQKKQELTQKKDQLKQQRQNFQTQESQDKEY